VHTHAHTVDSCRLPLSRARSPCFPLLLSRSSLALLLCPSGVTRVSLFVTEGAPPPHPSIPLCHVRVCTACSHATIHRGEMLATQKHACAMQKHACAALYWSAQIRGPQYPRTPMPNAVYGAQGCSWLPKPQSLRPTPKPFKSEPKDPSPSP
jgi:hypothetical protein